MELPKRPVHDEGSLITFEYYANLLRNMKVKAQDHTKVENGDTTSLEHLLFMCEFCIPRIRDDGKGMPVDKYSRWLGYVQGCLISQKITDVETERNRTRPWLARS